MSEATWTKARALGIPDADMRSALLLVRDFRAKAYRMKLDPMAVRVAIVFLDRSDLHFTKQKLPSEMIERLREIGEEVYRYIAEKDGR